MPQRSLFMLVGAICLGLLAVFLMRNYIGTGGAAVSGTAAVVPRSVHVVIAAEPVEAAPTLDRSKLKLVAWPADSVPAGSFQTIASIPADRALIASLVPGEPLLAGKLNGGGPRPGIATRIATGMRAASIRVTDVTGTGGFILPGEHVDVLVTQTATQTNTPFTDLLAQNVRVIAVNQDANEAKDKPEVVQSITVEVTPLQASKLALAGIVGTLSLNLRNPANAAAQPTPTVRIADLRDHASPAPANVIRRAAPRRARRVVRSAPRVSGSTVTVVRGVEAATYQIARSE